MKKILLFGLMLLATVLNAQIDRCQVYGPESNDGHEDSGCGIPTSPDWDFYRDMNTYIPYLTPNEPLKNKPITTIDININIVQRDDGSGNFENSQETIDRFITILDYINSFYRTYSPSDPIPWVTELPNYDSRIRFSLGDPGEERIYFYQNSSLANSTGHTMEQYLSDNHQDRLKQINIYIFCGSGDPEDAPRNAKATMPSWSNYDENMYIITWFWRPVSDWASAGTLAHELGHTLGLFHTYHGGGTYVTCDIDNREYLRDIFLVEPPTTSNCPHTCDWHADAFAVNGDGITNNLMGGNKSTGYISPIQAGQLHRSLALSSARKYAKCAKSSIPLVISNHQVWDFNIQLYRDIVIEQGATLEITCGVLMHPDAKIRVKKGGYLIVDGSQISCSDKEKFWKGIEIEGQRGMPGSLAYQGAVRLINGATIANAKKAVQLYIQQDDGEPIISSAGGILLANDAHFVNNKVSVDAVFYEQAANSIISDSYFTIDSAYYAKTSTQPIMCKLYKTNDILFSNNIFENQFTNDIYFDYNKLPIGIKAHNVGLNIINGNTFKNLRYGVHAIETQMSGVSEIRDNNFENNITGIYMSDVHAPQIYLNTFKVKPFNAAWEQMLKLSGIYLDGVIGHSVEENNFEGYRQEKHRTIGIVVNQGGAQDVEIYKNTFTEFNYAILAQNSNRSADGLHGLCFTCNEFTNNESDMNVASYSIIHNPTHGIAINQGAPNMPAGNKFTPAAFNPLQWNIYNLNGRDKTINYYLSQSAYNSEIPEKTNNVRKVNCWANVFPNPCDSRHPNTGGDNELKNRMADAGASAQTIQAELLTRTDEGNTNHLQTDVTTTTTDAAYQMRNRLLNLAPYTSETVLKEVVTQENTINNALIRDVLVANPQSAKSKTVMEAVETKTQPMPDYMLEEIEAGKTIISTKEQKEADLYQNTTNYTDALHDLLYLYSTDSTLVNAQDSILSTLQKSNNVYDYYLLADMYLQMQAAADVQTTLSQIPNRFTLSQEQEADYQALAAYYTWRVDLLNAGKNLSALEESDIAQLQVWMEDECTILSTKALNALRAASAITYEEPYILPDDNGVPPAPSAPIELSTTDKKPASLVSNIKLYPNPATDYVVLEYQLDTEKLANACIRVIESGSGKLVWTRAISKPQDALTIDLEQLSVGHYEVQLILDGQSVHTSALSISK